MMVFAASFYEIVYMLWYSVYSRDGNWKDEPDKYLVIVYQYLHLHRMRVDALQQRFEQVDDRVLHLVFEYLGYSAVEYDGKRHYVLPNAPDFLKILIFSEDKDNDCHQLIDCSKELLQDPEHRMIQAIQKREHT